MWGTRSSSSSSRGSHKVGGGTKYEFVISATAGQRNKQITNRIGFIVDWATSTKSYPVQIENHFNMFTNVIFFAFYRLLNPAISVCPFLLQGIIATSTDLSPFSVRWKILQPLAVISPNYFLHCPPLTHPIEIAIYNASAIKVNAAVFCRPLSA